MFTENMPVIIDFGSCSAEGDDLSLFGRTYEWYDETVDTAAQKNDLDALQEIDTWLRGSVDDLKFAS